MAALLMKSRRKGRRFGTYLAIVPLLVISTVVAYQIITDIYFQTGTLSVNAQSSAKYFRAVGLNATASVGSRAGVTPFTLSLTQGSYSVAFSSLEWYTSPPPRGVNVVAGKTAYIVGVYDPNVDYVAISQSQFNATSVLAMHGVTPVIWLNKMGQNVAIVSDPTGLVTILPNQNFTFVFPAAGSYSVRLPQFSSPPLVVSAQ